MRFDNTHNQPNENKTRVLFWFVAACMSFGFAETYGRTLPVAIFLSTWAHGQIEAPFRRRLLTQQIYKAVEHFHGNQPFHGANSVIPVESIINMGVAFVAVFLLILVARAAISHFVEQKQLKWMSLLAVYMLIYLQIMPTDLRAQFPYDLPAALFFGTATMGALTHRRWIFYPAFLVGTFNKESTFFLVALLFVAYLDESKPIIWALRLAPKLLYLEVFANFLIWRGIVKFCEHISGGPGRGMVEAAGANLHLLLNPRHWITVLSVFGYLWIPCVLLYKRLEPVRLRRCLLLLIPWLVVLFRFGDVIEIRTHGEWVVFMTLITAVLMDRSVRIIPESCLDLKPQGRAQIPATF